MTGRYEMIVLPVAINALWCCSSKFKAFCDDVKTVLHPRTLKHVTCHYIAANSQQNIAPSFLHVFRESEKFFRSIWIALQLCIRFIQYLRSANVNVNRFTYYGE